MFFSFPKAMTKPAILSEKLQAILFRRFVTGKRLPVSGRIPEFKLKEGFRSPDSSVAQDGKSGNAGRDNHLIHGYMFLGGMRVVIRFPVDG